SRPLHLFLLPCSPAHRDLHSFPTRRSSDLRTSPPDARRLGASRAGSPLFSNDLLEHLLIQRQIRHHTLQALVLLLERFEPLGLGSLHPAVLLLPAIERLLADVVPPADLTRRLGDLGLLEHRDDLRLGEPLLLHLPLQSMRWKLTHQLVASSRG